MLTLRLYCTEACFSRPATIEDLEIAGYWHVENEHIMVQTSPYSGAVIKRVEVTFMNDGRICDATPSNRWAVINAEETEEVDGELEIIRTIPIGYLPFEDILF